MCNFAANVKHDGVGASFFAQTAGAAARTGLCF